MENWLGNHDELVLPNRDKLLRAGGIQEIGVAKYKNYARRDECQGVHCILGAWGFGNRKSGYPTGVSQVNEISRGCHSETGTGVGSKTIFEREFRNCCCNSEICVHEILVDIARKCFGIGMKVMERK
jgi:hypothetical protein